MRLISSFLMLSLFCSSALFAQTAPPIGPKPFIGDLLKDVSPKRIENYDRKLVSFGTRNTNSAQHDPKRGIGAARDWIYSEFQKVSTACNGCLDVQKQTFLQEQGRRIPVPVNITNITATLKGITDPDRVYVVSGHYDSICGDPGDGVCDAPGANDDGSGTAAVIEMARVMSKRRYDATIIFMAVAGEEQGLYGATYFADQAQKENMDIEAMLTNDIIGGVRTFRERPDRNTVRVFTEGVPSIETEQQAAMRRNVGGENDSPARQLGRFIKETADLYTPDFKVTLIYRRDRYLRGGDHIPFLERGYPAVRFTEPHEDYNHQHQNVRRENGVFYGDTLEYVDFDYMAKVTRVNIASIASLALAPPTPRDAKIVLNRLTNDTDLTWSASTAGDIVGYEIVWRATTAPVWTNSKFVGDVTNYTMKDMSKDNWFFGIRAVDRDGYRSSVAYPQPE